MNPSYQGKHLQTFFIIGNHWHIKKRKGQRKSKTIQDVNQALQREIDQYDDFVVGDFHDNYINLPIKTFVAHTFVQEHCHQAKWVIIHDDDVVLDWHKVSNVLNLDNTKQLDLRCLRPMEDHTLPQRFFDEHGVLLKNSVLGKLYS